MSRQKCMSFPKCSNLEAKKLHTSNFVIKEIKGRTVISNKQNVENDASEVGFTLLTIKLIDKLELKRRLTVTKL